MYMFIYMYIYVICICLYNMYKIFYSLGSFRNRHAFWLVFEILIIFGIETKESVFFLTYTVKNKNFFNQII